MMIFLIILVMEPEEEEISLTLKRDTGRKWGFAFAGKVNDYFKRYLLISILSLKCLKTVVYLFTRIFFCY